MLTLEKEKLRHMSLPLVLCRLNRIDIHSTRIYIYIYIYLYITTADVAVLQEEMRQFLIEKTKVTVIFKGQTAI